LNFSAALTQRGHDSFQFDLKSAVPLKFPHLFPKVGDQAQPYSVFGSSETCKLKKRDFGVIIPFATRNVTPDYLAGRQKE